MRNKVAGPRSHFDYSVVVTHRDGGYALCIRELLLYVRAADLEVAYEELMKRKQEVIESAQSIGALDEVPPARWPAVLDAVGMHPPGSAVLSRLRRAWKAVLTDCGVAP